MTVLFCVCHIMCFVPYIHTITSYCQAPGPVQCPGSGPVQGPGQGLNSELKIQCQILKRQDLE